MGKMARNKGVFRETFEELIAKERRLKKKKDISIFVLNTFSWLDWHFVPDFLLILESCSV